MSDYIENLHTNSRYVTWKGSLEAVTSSPQVLLQQQIDRTYEQLLLKEESFYNQFGYHSAADFFNGIRQIMQNSKEDFQILNNFTSNNIRIALQQFNNYAEQKLQKQGFLVINFQCKDDPGQKIMEALRGLAGSNNVTFTGGNLSIGFEWNPVVLKQILNKVQKTGLKTSSNNVTDALRIIHQEKLITLTTKGTKDLPPQEIPIRESPFNYSKDEINKMDNSQLVALRNEMLNFIIDGLGISRGSATLQMAAQIVLNQSIMSKITDLSFFAGGNGVGGWINKIVGALGEFRAAVFFEYLAVKCPNPNLASQITKIIGNQSGSNNQQFHSDLQIFENFGIQVKNYNSAYISGSNVERTVEVRLHPMEIAPIMSDIEFASYLINSYFNADLGKVDTSQLKDFFEANALELLNLDLPTTINIPAKVSFYLVGNSLIPGSEIIRNSFMTKDKLITVKETTISGTEGDSSEGYEKGDPPKFIKWWHGYENNWNPTDINELASWDKNISIRTKFTYATFWDMHNFDIF